jgi:phosphatidylglycerophosphate synthase
MQPAATSVPAHTAMRRPLRSRQSRWAGLAAGWLVRRHVQPNTISLASVAFAVLAGVCLAATSMPVAVPRVLLLLVAAASIQLRLVCNLLDGMVAIEGGLKTRSGELYNEVPDRVADTLILVGAGYGVAWGPSASTLGWVAATLAITTAYVRLLGVSVGAPQYFIGPMAKQHRMAVLTAACFVGVLETVLAQPHTGGALGLSLLVIILGLIVTVGRRLQRIAADLERR